MSKLLSAIIVSTLLASPALAGEGGGDPFPFSAPPEVTAGNPGGFDVGQARMPTFSPAFSFAFNGAPTTQPSREGEVQTAGSLPRNALVGTAEYAQEQATARWFASRSRLRNVAQR